VRLDANEIFDAKRSEVQQRMRSDKAEDSLWLKSKQIKDILTKEIEENARWKEETAKRFGVEQKEIKTQKRENLLSKFNPEIFRNEFENMGDETFNTFLSGIEKSYNDKIEAEKAEAKRIEDERIAKEKEIEAQRLENVKLKEEAEARARVEAKRVAKEIADAKERQLKEKAAKDAHDAVLRKEREAREKVEAELKAKKDAELKAIKDAEEKAKAEKAAQEKSEKEALLAPDKIKLENLANEIVKITLPEVKSDEAKEVLKKVQILLNKTSNYIKEESVKL